MPTSYGTAISQGAISAVEAVCGPLLNLDAGAVKEPCNLVCPELRGRSRPEAADLDACGVPLGTLKGDPDPKRFAEGSFPFLSSARSVSSFPGCLSVARHQGPQTIDISLRRVQ